MKVASNEITIQFTHTDGLKKEGDKNSIDMQLQVMIKSLFGQLQNLKEMK